MWRFRPMINPRTIISPVSGHRWPQACGDLHVFMDAVSRSCRSLDLRSAGSLPSVSQRRSDNRLPHPPMGGTWLPPAGCRPFIRFRGVIAGALPQAIPGYSTHTVAGDRCPVRERAYGRDWFRYGHHIPGFPPIQVLTFADFRDFPWHRPGIGGIMSTGRPARTYALLSDALLPCSSSSQMCLSATFGLRAGRSLPSSRVAPAIVVVSSRIWQGTTT